jgi:transposase
MPKAIEADWDLIQTLYTAGTSANEISRKMGVSVSAIQTRASRHDWRRLAAEVASKVSRDAQQAAKEVGDQLRQELGLHLKAHVKSIPQARGWKHAARINQELVPLISNAQKVFGWQESVQAPAVRINVMASAVRIQDSAEAKAIDIESSTVDKG